MPQTIRVPGMGDVQFPDGMSDEDITAAIQRNMREQRPKYLPSSPLTEGVSEAATNFATGAIAAPIAGLAGLGAMATNAMGMTDTPAADVVRGVQGALTYQPRTQAGQKTAGAIAYPFEKLAQGADYVGGKVAEVSDSPAIGAGVNAGLQFLPALLLSKGAKAFQGRSAPPANPAGVAEAYVRSNVPGVDWAALPDTVKASLTDIAKNSGDLSKLDPAAVARQARFASLNVPATRGQLTRDPVQLRNEANASATEAGKPIRDTYVAQNKAIVDNLRAIKDETGATAASPDQVGTAAQEAARAKLKYQERRVSKIYEAADKSAETLQKVDVTPLFELIEKTPDVTQYGWAQSWMKKVGAEPGMGMTIRDLESLRKAAVAKTKNGGEQAHYAGELIRSIDSATEGAGGKLYQAARKARRDQALEFQDQAGVARLVENKSRTDPAVALEDTWRRTVIGGSNADLMKVRDSLTKGGTPRTREMGMRAWKEMQGATMDHIIAKATKSVAKFEDGTPNLTTAALKSAIDSVGKAKIDIQFGPGVYERLNKILEVTADAKTKPPSMIDGSPTVANALAYMEKLAGKIPIVGNTATGAARLIANLNESGAASKSARMATTDPLVDAANNSRNAMYSRRAKNTLVGATVLDVTAKERK